MQSINLKDHMKSTHPGLLFLMCIGVLFGTPIIVALCFITPYIWILGITGLILSIFIPLLISNQVYYNKVGNMFGYYSILKKLLTCPKCLSFWSTIFILTILCLFIFDYWIYNFYMIISFIIFPFLNASLTQINFICLSILKGDKPLKCCGQ